MTSPYYQLSAFLFLLNGHFNKSITKIIITANRSTASCFNFLSFIIIPPILTGFAPVTLGLRDKSLHNSDTNGKVLIYPKQLHNPQSLEHYISNIKILQSSFQPPAFTNTIPFRDERIAVWERIITINNITGSVSRSAFIEV